MEVVNGCYFFTFLAGPGGNWRNGFQRPWGTPPPPQVPRISHAAGCDLDLDPALHPW